MPTSPLPFKEVYCSDCKRVLARYSTKYFTDANINELVRLQFSSHIKNGHAVGMRFADDVRNEL
ncbi:MAG: hypothetical protein M3258_07915 [Thermoproteota archaeon]|nr:hypothetical protein [Thermoproteota archaeon]